MATFTESFDQPDSTTLGPDLTWTEVAGQWETIGGQAAMNQTGVNAYARPGVDTGSADMYVEAVIPTTAAFNAHYIDFQVMARMDASTITGYCLVRGYWASAGGQFVMLRKYVNGQESQVAAPIKLSAALPETWRLEVEGSDVRAYRDGVLVISGTDSTITTGTRAGLGGYQTTTDFNRLIRFDSFETGQLGAAPPENKTGIGHITQAQALTSAGTKDAYGTATLTQAHTITGTGHRVSDDRTGTGTLTQTAATASTGRKGGQGSAEPIDFYAMLTGTGEGSTTKHATGTGHITQAHTSTVGGHKGARGTVALAQAHDLATTGTKHAAATGALTQAHTSTATGTKGGRGHAAITQAHTITGVGAGEGQQAGNGTGSITQPTPTLAGTGAKSARGRAGSVTVATAIRAEGVKGGRGIASIAQVHTTTATGRRGAHGTAHLTQDAHTAATGYRGGYGTASITQVHTVTGAGFNPSSLRDIELTLGPLHTRGPTLGPLHVRPFALAPLRR